MSQSVRWAQVNTASASHYQCRACFQYQFTLNAGAGLGVPIGSLGDRAQLGYSVTVGAGINFGPRFSTALDYNANCVDVDLAQNLGFYSVRLWNLTANPRIRFNMGEGLQLYVTGGYGLYARDDPMNRSTYEGGMNGGCGFGLRLSESVTLYFEVKYHRMFTTAHDTAYAPFIMGVRWH